MSARGSSPGLTDVSFKGKDELLLIDQYGGLAIYSRDPGKVCQFSSSLRVVDGGVINALVVDADANGRLDIVVGFGNGTLMLYKSSINGTAWARVIVRGCVRCAVVAPRSLALGDAASRRA